MQTFHVGGGRGRGRRGYPPTHGDEAIFPTLSPSVDTPPTTTIAWHVFSPSFANAAHSPNLGPQPSSTTATAILTVAPSHTRLAHDAFTSWPLITGASLKPYPLSLLLVHWLLKEMPPLPKRGTLPAAPPCIRSIALPSSGDDPWSSSSRASLVGKRSNSAPPHLFAGCCMQLPSRLLRWHPWRRRSARPCRLPIWPMLPLLASRCHPVQVQLASVMLRRHLRLRFCPILMTWRS